MKLTKLLINSLLLCFTLSPCFAQSNDVDEITGRAKKKRVLGQITWLKDGEGFSTLEWNSKVGANDVVRYEAKDDARSVLIPAEKFIDKATGKPIGVSSFQWSDDNSKILIFNNTKRVWRYNTRGDYWVLDLVNGNLRQIGKDKPESSLMFAKFSPDGKKVAYVSRNNIYVEDVATGATTARTAATT